MPTTIADIVEQSRALKPLNGKGPLPEGIKFEFAEVAQENGYIPHNIQVVFKASFNMMSAGHPPKDTYLVYDLETFRELLGQYANISGSGFDETREEVRRAAVKVLSYLVHTREDVPADTPITALEAMLERYPLRTLPHAGRKTAGSEPRIDA